MEEGNQAEGRSQNQESNNRGSQGNDAAEKLLDQLRDALKKDGSFPANAQLVLKLQQLVSNPKTSANEIAKVILKEPSIATRLLHFVNSSFYQRSKPIMTVSQAVVQIGMEPLSELFSGLVILEQFALKNDKDKAFVQCMQKTLCTSLIASKFTPLVNLQEDPDNELGYLSGTFSEIGVLCLAYYFPRIFATAAKSAQLQKVSLDHVLREITGLNSYGLSLEVIKVLELPSIYKSIIHECTHNDSSSTNQGDISKISDAVKVSQEISNAIIVNRNKIALEAAIEKVTVKLGVNIKEVHKVIGSLPKLLHDHCDAIDMPLLELPDFVKTYAVDESELPDIKFEANEKDLLAEYIEEIKTSIQLREPPASIITMIMETLAWGMGFDRVLLLLVTQDKSELRGRMLLGGTKTDPSTIVRPLGYDAGRFAPDARAFQEGRPIFRGDPLFSNAWPLVCFPVGFEDRCLGVIYADKLSYDLSSKELNEREVAMISVLAELLDHAIKTNPNNTDE